jgi:toxin HigB-1
LEIRYRDKQLRKLCEVRAAAERSFGAPCAAKLRVRLMALEAATRVAHLVAGNPHPLKAARAGQFALNLVGGFRLVFSAVNDPRPELPGGGVDWLQVTAVCIEFIGDYHD